MVRRRIGDLGVVVAEDDLPDGPVHLRIAGNRKQYAFSVSADGRPRLIRV
jgi:hypothetical protein